MKIVDNLIARRVIKKAKKVGYPDCGRWKTKTIYAYANKVWNISADRCRQILRGSKYNHLDRPWMKNVA